MLLFAYINRDYAQFLYCTEHGNGDKTDVLMINMLVASTTRTRVQILCCGVKTLGKFFHSTLLQFTQLNK